MIRKSYILCVSILIGIGVNSLELQASNTDESYPGENLINNESLLKNRIETMNTCLVPEYSDILRTKLAILLKTRKDHTEGVLGRMIMYYPQVDSIFDANDIPTDLKYITFIESSLNPHAVSRAGAVGMWQFMNGTAEMLNLRISRVVDERKDPYVSTQAAVKYLKKLHDIYQDWALVLLAYNSGPGRVNEAMNRSGGTTYTEIKNHLPKETQEYIPKFLATVFFFKNHAEFGYEALMPDLDLILTKRKVIHKKISFDKLHLVAKDLTPGILERLNPSYKHRYIPTSKDGYFLVLPSRYRWVFDSMYTDIEEDLQLEDDIKVDVTLDSLQGEVNFMDPYYEIKYRVKTGQTLAKIARLLDVNFYQLKYWNKKKNNRIKAGEYLVAYVEKNSYYQRRLPFLNTEVIQKIPANGIKEIKKNILFSENNAQLIKQSVSKNSYHNPNLIDFKNTGNAIFLLRELF